MAFQVGDERVHVGEWFGTPVSVDAYRWLPDRVADLLGQAGFAVLAQLLREADESEKVQRAYLLAKKPGKA